MHGSGTHPQVDQEENVAAEKEAQCRFCQEMSERKKESSHKCENLGREFHDFKDAETMIIVDVNQNRNNSFRIHSQTLKLCNYRMKERIQLTKLIKEKIRKIDKRDRKNYDHYAITLAVDEDKTEEEEKDKEDKTEEKDSRKEDKIEDAENIEIKLEPVIENTDPIEVNLEDGQYTLEVCNEIDCKKQAIYVDQGHWTTSSITIPDSGIRFKVNKLRRKMKKELIEPESESIIHTSSKSFKCPKCDSVFTRKDTQKDHMKLKHAEKPKNQCWLCLKAHGKKSDLKSHIHTKHNDYTIK